MRHFTPLCHCTRPAEWIYCWLYYKHDVCCDRIVTIYGAATAPLWFAERINHLYSGVTVGMKSDSVCGMDDANQKSSLKFGRATFRHRTLERR